MDLNCFGIFISYLLQQKIEIIKFLADKFQSYRVHVHGAD
jgi:hypothetical protein